MPSSLHITFTVSGGFAVVQPNSVMSINAVEGYPLEDFSAEAIRAQIVEAQKVANGNGSEQDIAEAKIELEVRPLFFLALFTQSLTLAPLGPREPAASCEVNAQPPHNAACVVYSKIP